MSAVRAPITFGTSPSRSEHVAPIVPERGPDSGRVASGYPSMPVSGSAIVLVDQPAEHIDAPDWSRAERGTVSGAMGSSRPRLQSSPQADGPHSR